MSRVTQFFFLLGKHFEPGFVLILFLIFGDFEVRWLMSLYNCSYKKVFMGEGRGGKEEKEKETKDYKHQQWRGRSHRERCKHSRRKLL